VKHTRKRSKDGSEGGQVFTHPLFVRGRPDLVSQIKRKTNHEFAAQRSPEELLREELEGLRREHAALRGAYRELAMRWRAAEAGLGREALAAAVAAAPPMPPSPPHQLQQQGKAGAAAGSGRRGRGARSGRGGRRAGGCEGEADAAEGAGAGAGSAAQQPSEQDGDEAAAYAAAAAACFEGEGDGEGEGESFHLSPAATAASHPHSGASQPVAAAGYFSRFREGGRLRAPAAALEYHRGAAAAAADEEEEEAGELGGAGGGYSRGGEGQDEGQGYDEEEGAEAGFGSGSPTRTASASAAPSAYADAFACASAAAAAAAASSAPRRDRIRPPHARPSVADAAGSPAAATGPGAGSAGELSEGEGPAGATALQPRGSLFPSRAKRPRLATWGHEQQYQNQLASPSPRTAPAQPQTQPALLRQPLQSLQPLLPAPALHAPQQQHRQPFPTLDRLGSFDTLPVQSLQAAALASASAAPLAQPAWSGGLAPLSPQAVHGSGSGALSLPASLQAASVPTSAALGLALTAAAAAGGMGSSRSMGMAISDEEEEGGAGAGSSRIGLQACPSVGSAEEEVAGLRGEGGFGLSMLQHPRSAAGVTAAAAAGLAVPPSPAALQRSESQSQHHPASPALLLCRLQSLGLSTPAPQAAAAGQEACMPAMQQQQQDGVGVSGRIALVPSATGPAVAAAFPVAAAGPGSRGFGELPAPLPLLQMLPPAGAGSPAAEAAGAPPLPPLQHPLLHLHAPSFAGPSAFAPSGSATPSALHLFPLPAAPGFGSGRLPAASSLLSRRASAFSPTYAAATAPSAGGSGAGGLHMSLSVSPPASHTPLPLTQQQQPAPLHHPTPQQHQLASATAPAAALLAAGLTVTAAAAVTRLTSAAASLYMQQQQQQQSAAAASRLHHQQLAAPQPLHSHAVSGGEVSVTA